MLIGGPAQGSQRNTAQQSNPNLLRHTQQQSMDPYISRNKSTLQPGPAKSIQPAHKRPWKPALVPSSQAGSMPPRPAGASAAGARRLARPAEGQLQAHSQPRMTMSQPNSFQEFAPSGTPDRQYMLPGDQWQPQNGSAAYYMPSSQPSSGVDSIDCTPARPSSTQSFSQARHVACSAAHQQGQRHSQLPPNSSMRPVLQSQRQPSPAHMQQRRILAQQQHTVRATQRPLHFDTSQPGSQVLTPQSSQTQRSSQAHQLSHAVQGNQGTQLQNSQGLQMSSSQDLLVDGNHLAQPGGNTETRDWMLAQTTRGMHPHISQGLPSSQLEQGNQAMPHMYLTQPSPDTFAWSEETQADPPLTVNAATDAQAMHQCTVQQGFLETAKPPAADSSISEKPAQSGNAVVAAAAAAGPAPPSKLRMKMKSLAAAAAINSSEAANQASAADSRQQDNSALPLSLPAPAADQGDCSGQHLANLPDDLKTSCSTEQAAAAEAAAAAAAEAAKATAAQVKQALEAATAAQDECKAMVASATAAAKVDKENQEAKHVEALSRIAGVQGSCTTLSSAIDTLQSICDTQAANLSAVESTCQTLLGLLHGLSTQTQQAVAALETCQGQQPAVTVLRCLEIATQTSPVRVWHKAVQAELSPMTTGPSSGGDKGVLPVSQAAWIGNQQVANAPMPNAQPASAAGMPQKVSVLATSQLKPQAHAEPLDTTLLQLQGSSRQGQDKPGQKRKLAPSGLQQQKVKQQRVVYNEFSTSTDSTSESDCSVTSVGTEDDRSPHEQPGYHAKTPQPQQQQQHVVPTSAPFKLPIAPRHHTPGHVSPPDKESEGDSQPAAPDQKASGPPRPKAYSHSKKAAQPTKPPAGATTKVVVDKAKLTAKVTAAHNAEPTALAKRSKPQQSAVQEVKQVSQAPTPAGGFAELLQAMLDEGDYHSAPGIKHGTANPVLDRHPVNTAPKPNVLGDVTNTQGHTGGSASKPPAGKARTAAAAAAAARTSGKTAADKASAKMSAPTAMNGVSKTESKGAGRRSARVPSKNQQSKSDKEQPLDASPAVELFSGAYQESMPSIDDEDIERQVKERMQRHRLKNQKRFSRRKP